jgi:ADP-heptose:LPS heptosyltransferase
MAGKLKLQQELQLISNLDVMLSMDSGMHIAAMLGVKVITLWGATHPYAGFYPLINQWKMRWFLIEINFQNTHFGIWK